MPKFQKGDRVRLSAFAVRSTIVSEETRGKRRGTIRGEARAVDCWTVLWDGKKGPQTWHQDFLEAVDEVAE